MSVTDGLAMPGAKGFSSFESILGPQIVGNIFSTALWGVIFVQTYDYFIIPNKDHLWQKLVVALLFILNTFESILVIHPLYLAVVKNFLNPSYLTVVPWTLSTRAVVNGVISFIVRTMFARRIYLVSGKNITLTLWIMGVSTADLVAGILVTTKSLLGLYSTQLPSLKNLIILSFTLGIVSDLSVTVSLFWLLHSVKTGIRKTNTLVKTLMLYVVTTGLLVVIDLCLGITFYLVMPDNLVFFVFHLLFGKLYINAYLASLNGREKLRLNQTDVAISLSHVSYKNRETAAAISATDDDKPTPHGPENTISIVLRTSTERKTDDQEDNNFSSAIAI